VAQILAKATDFIARGARAPSRAAVGALADCFFQSYMITIESFSRRANVRRGLGVAEIRAGFADWRRFLLTNCSLADTTSKSLANRPILLSRRDITRIARPFNAGSYAANLKSRSLGNWPILLSRRDITRIARRFNAGFYAANLKSRRDG
jgi:hypothetical protein